jgi:hypothetical protein
MSALLLEIHPAVGGGPPVAATGPARQSLLALLAGALAPWLLLVGLQGVLHTAAAACLAGPFPA